MEAVVIYKSKTGFAEKYADWISEELSADMFESSKVSASQLDNYDTIIYGGGIYSGVINGVKLIINNFEKLRDKKLIVFATGLSFLTEERIEMIKTKNFTLDQQDHIKFYYFQGGFDFDKLNFSDKMTMGMIRRKLRKKSEENLTNNEKGMLASFEAPVDYSSEDKISELIAYVNS